MRSAKITVDCGSLGEPTAGTIDQIASLKLVARRCNCELELTNANPYLLELIDFVGLAGVLGLQTGRQAEQRKELCGIEEEGELGDPPAR